MHRRRNDRGGVECADADLQAEAVPRDHANDHGGHLSLHVESRVQCHRIVSFDDNALLRIDVHTYRLSANVQYDFFFFRDQRASVVGNCSRL